MNYQEKVAWLGRYQTALSCQRMLEEEITVLRSDAARVTACMSGMPGRSGPDADRLPRAVEHIEDDSFICVFFLKIALHHRQFIQVGQ